MKKTAKRFFSMMLALAMVFSLMVAPAAAAETDGHVHTNEAGSVVETAGTIIGKVDIDLTGNLGIGLIGNPAVSMISAPEAFLADETDPVMKNVAAELKDIKVLNEDGESVALTEEQINTVLYLYSEYQKIQTNYASHLGVQTPFFLTYNDNEDSLGVLGEMLVLAGVSVDMVRSGQYSYDDLVGMIQNFTYADRLGVEYYGKAISTARNEVMELIEESGAKTGVQKLLVLNDWMAHINTFDMPYIMNADKDTNGDGVIDDKDNNTDPMVAETPQPHEHYQDVYDVIYADYLVQIEDTFKQQIRDGLKAEMQKGYYQGAIEELYYKLALAGAQQQAVEEALEAITAGARQTAYEDAYEAAYAEEEKKVYDEAYAAYFEHEHNYDVTFKWTETTDAETGEGLEEWTATATLTCTVGGESVTVDAEVETLESSTAPTCTSTGKAVLHATATYDKNYYDTQEFALEALGHNWDESKICTRCGVVSDEHTHSFDSNEGEYTKYTWTEQTDELGKKNGVFDATVEATCMTCKAEFTGESKGIQKSSTTATCTQDGQDIWAAIFELKDAEGNVVGTINGAHGEFANATGHDDANDDGICDNCNESMTSAGGEGGVTPNAEGEESEDGEGDTGEEVDPDADAYAKAAVEAAKEEIEAAAAETANAAADKYVEDNAEALQKQAEDAIANDADAQAKIEAGAKTATETFMTENAEAIDADPVAFLDGNELFQTEVPVTGEDGNPVLGEDGNPVMMTLAAQVHAGWDPFWAECEEKGVPGMIAQIKLTAYQEAIKSAMMENGQTEEQANAYLEQNAEAIAADPYAFCAEAFGEDAADQMEAGINDQLKQMGLDPSTETNPEGRVHLDIIVAMQMDTAMADLGGMTPNEAIPVYADQAAQGLTTGVINYWEGSQFGALGFGTSVCLGYTKAYTYLVQYIHPEIYGINGANTDMSASANWKTVQELYYDADGNLKDINSGYVVDTVRVTFDATVTMFGETEDNFNSDHFWNAVKVDGKWYYADPCYTDVFTEVMIRDRVETDGSMNHLYFLFSDTAARDMYDGNYKEIKTLYYDGTTDYTSNDLEDSWVSRIKSNTYFDGSYAYYIYDSTDLLTLMDEFNNSDNMQDTTDLEMNGDIKLVRHSLSNADAGNTAESFDTFIFFNEEQEDGSYVAKVFKPGSNEGVANEMLTELYAKHAAYSDIYPSIAITTALYNGKLYFNIANCILSYDLENGDVAMVKEYNTVYGAVDKTAAFRGMGFSVSASETDYVVNNAPIAAMTIKPDGKMYVSVATNYAFISGKADRADPASEGYGYAYQESNFNPDYSTYMDIDSTDMSPDQLEQFGYEEEINDNDEFMWTANFVETLNMSHLAGTSHTYSEVSVDAFCGMDAFVENRCETCGAIEPETRVYEDGTAHDHHYIEFNETYYTKDDNGNFNVGMCYVCAICGFHIEEPKEPTQNQYNEDTYEEDYAEYERLKAIWDAAVADNGHDYVPADAEWAEDNKSVTFSVLECSSVCPERLNKVDFLVNDETITLELEEEQTIDAVLDHYEGYCEDGPVAVYIATGEVNHNGTVYTFTATKKVQLEPGHIRDENDVCVVCGDGALIRVSGDDRYATAYAVAERLKTVMRVEKFDTIIVAAGGNFPDALSGSYLSTEKDAPILLTAKGQDTKVLEYIQNNLAEGGKVYILGGVNSVSEDLENGLKNAGIAVTRLSGNDRYLTNLAILEEAGMNGNEIIVSDASNYADSLSASATNLPILLVNNKSKKLTDEQIAYLDSLEGDLSFYIVGGPSSVDDAFATILGEYGTVERVSGDSREQTSVAVARKFYAAPKNVVLAYSWNFPDGLCGGLLAHKVGAPLLLVNSGAETAAAEYVAETGVKTGYILGGVNSVTEESVAIIFDLPAEDAE